MSNDTKTPEEHGAEDLHCWIDDQTISNPDADPADLAAEILPTGDQQHEPDEALINAMGRAWILEQIDLVDTEENWSGPGLAWCERYNAGYWAAAREVAGEAKP